jgi:nucleoside-diphosphate-sugar epimerase
MRVGQPIVPARDGRTEPMTCLVTGAAGFIGSHLCERLVLDGHRVRGIDAFVPYYPRSIKEQNLAWLRSQSVFELLSIDLRSDALAESLAGVDAVFHLAAMPGLPLSWTDFQLYESCNLSGTHRLLDATVAQPRIPKFIYASTSSVYGREATGDESQACRPISPYGVTKLAAENLGRAFADERGLPFVGLRYFSVYGPRQRPDMAYNRFITALRAGSPIRIFGDGQQVRGNTFVADCVAATVFALQAPSGAVFNVGGGESVSVRDVVHKLESLIGRRAVLEFCEPRPGDQRATLANTALIERTLNWRPKVGIDEGLARQVEWHESQALPAAA